MLSALTAGQTQGKPQTKTKQFSGLKVGKRIALLLFLLSCKQIQIGKTKKFILKKVMAISRFKFEGTKSGNPSVYNYFV